MTMKKILLYLLFIFVPFCWLLAQSDIKNSTQIPSRYYLVQADENAKRISYRGNTDLLVKELTEPYGNPFLKWRAIYTWIALNIDSKIQFNNNISIYSEDTEIILAIKKTTNKGYAKLMEYLCNKAGLECTTITGWVKTTPKDIQQINWSEPLNAWNAIKINGEWRYCDVAWATGYTKEGKKEKYRKNYSDAFFNMSVHDIFLQHYPEYPFWQKEYPMTKASFEDLPLFYREFFTMNIHDLNIMTRNLKKNSRGKVTISFRTPWAIHSIHYSGCQTVLPFKWIKDKYFIKVNPGEKGTVVTVYVNNNPLVAYIAE
jgi:transglutaminase/protease-like cytokinesis protein 3